jgi:hypothetical protein
MLIELSGELEPGAVDIAIKGTKPEVPLEPLKPDVPLEPLKPDVPLEPLKPDEPLEPLVPESADIATNISSLFVNDTVESIKVTGTIQ